MNNTLKKAKAIFDWSALTDIYRWSACAHKSILAITVLEGLCSVISLAMTMITKYLIDGATSANAHALWVFGIALVAITALQQVVYVTIDRINLKTNTTLQRHLQSMVTESLMGKEYASLKHFHSGELVSRIFSDVSVHIQCLLFSHAESENVKILEKIPTLRVPKNFSVYGEG